jgi:signal transduction histidine kinase
MPAPSFSSPDRATRVGVVALTVVVFAVAVGFVTYQLRAGLRQQVLGREATILGAVASLQLQTEAERNRDLGVSDPEGALFLAVLKTSKFENVFALRLFNAKREVVAAEPWVWSEEPPADATWRELIANRPVARLHARDAQTDLGGLLPAPSGDPLLEVWVPLRHPNAQPLLGVAQFWITGAAVASEFAAMDRRLVAQAGLAWLAGSVVIAAAMAWAFSRLAAANRELRIRSENLQRANRELVLAAKTSALGSVTAHLIHALKNPIAGLEVFVANRAESGARDDGGEELAAATELTRRLRTMVNDVVSVLRDEETGGQFELSADEMVELALAKARPVAAARSVRLAADINSQKTLPARRANLATLALYNLLQNAIEASPAGAAVRVTAREQAGGVEFTVADEGPGLPPPVRARLFEPCTSTKVGGSGLGLALSQQLARHGGGRIELMRSDAHGTCFRLVLDSEA